MNTRLLTALAALWITFSPHPASAGEPATPAAAPEMTAAEVKKVDRDARKITLKHDPIKALDMPAMTMVFMVKDAAMLEAVKPGDKVMFSVEKARGGYTVTSIKEVK